MENKMPDTFIKSDLRYEDVKWYRKRWFLVLTMLFFVPATILIAATGEVYAKRDGEVYKYSQGQKNNLIIFAALLMLIFGVRASLSE